MAATGGFSVGYAFTRPHASVRSDGTRPRLRPASPTPPGTGPGRALLTYQLSGTITDARATRSRAPSWSPARRTATSGRSRPRRTRTATTRSFFAASDQTGADPVPSPSASRRERLLRRHPRHEHAFERCRARRSTSSSGPDVLHDLDADRAGRCGLFGARSSASRPAATSSSLSPKPGRTRTAPSRCGSPRRCAARPSTSGRTSASLLALRGDARRRRRSHDMAVGARAAGPQGPRHHLRPPTLRPPKKGSPAADLRV